MEQEARRRGKELAMKPPEKHCNNYKQRWEDG